MLISEGVTSIREAARASLGVAVLPDWLIEEDLLSGQLVRVLPQWKAKALPLHVVYAGQRLLPARVSAFIDFAVRYMEDELRSESLPYAGPHQDEKLAPEVGLIRRCLTPSGLTVGFAALGTNCVLILHHPLAQQGWLLR